MLPAGGIALGEEPLAAAQRELLEETGYEAEGWRFLGRYACNANYGCGRVHIFTARNARRVAEPHSGDLEEMEIVRLTEDEVRQAVRDGSIAALGAVAALAMALDLRPAS
jgi:ADP-ribose pyrophosphatase